MHVVVISYFINIRHRFETRLLDIFNEVHQAYKQFDSRLKAEGFKIRVMRMFRAWEDWAVYPRDFLVKLQNTFLGLVLVDFGAELYRLQIYTELYIYTYVSNFSFVYTINRFTFLPRDG